MVEDDQYAIGLIIDRWPAVDGRYPEAAYAAAFGAVLAVQLLALAWFFLAPGGGVNDVARNPAGDGPNPAR